MKIEKGIPLPPTAGRTPKHPFARMDLFDSVLLTENAEKLRGYAHTYGQKSGKKFTTRREAGGVRVWRTE